MMWNTFLCLLPSVYLYICWDLWPIFKLDFFFLLFTFKSSLYILGNSPLSDMSFSYIFSQSVACLFILFNSVFRTAEVLILMKSSLINFSLIDHVFGASKKSLPNPKSSILLLIF